MASRIQKLAVVAVLVSTAAGSAPADGNVTSPDVNITDDGELVPFARCFITAGSLLNAKKQVRLDTCTATQVDVGLFNAEGLQFSDAEMPDRTDPLGVLRVLDESLKRLSDDERLPKGLTSAVGKIFVPPRNDAAVGAPQPTGGTSSEPPQRSVRT